MTMIALEPVWKRVTDMEDPLTIIRDLGTSIALIAETLPDDVGPAIQRLAWLMKERCGEVEDLRSDLWHMAHPDEDFRRVVLAGRAS